MMMRQTKTTIATWGVAGILVAGLLVFGCERSAGHMEQDEHGHGDGRAEHSGDTPHEEIGMGDDGHADEGGHGHDDSGMAESMRAAELTGKLSDGVRVIELKARKFAFDPATVIVKQGEKVRLRVTSEDVMHGIGIADYDIDRKLPPNETHIIDFTAGKAGRHHFHCTNYCGDGHGDMHGELVVLPER